MIPPPVVANTTAWPATGTTDDMTVTRFVMFSVAVRVIYAWAGTDPLAVVRDTGVLLPSVAVSTTLYGPLPVELMM